MKKKVTYVSLPFTGVLCVPIEGDYTEEEAIEKAYDEARFDEHCEEWEVTDKIVGGNVFYGIQNEIDTYVDYYEEKEEEE